MFFSIFNLSVILNSQTLIEAFSDTLYEGDKIALIGDNGSGKTTLLNLLCERMLKEGLAVGYLNQTLQPQGLSGGQTQMDTIFGLLRENNDLFLLDEPTNHLDGKNCQTVLNALKNPSLSFVVSSHDPRLLALCNKVWPIARGQLHPFNGTYVSYLEEIKKKSETAQHLYKEARKEKKEVHKALMKSQERTSKKREQGEKKIADGRWLPAVGDAKANTAEKAQGKNLNNLSQKRLELTEELDSLTVSALKEVKFHFTSPLKKAGVELIAVRGGTLSYQEGQVFAFNLNLTLYSGDHLVITSPNGCGKSSLLKALMGDNSLIKTGDWLLPPANQIGYIDQTHSGLNPQLTILETIAPHCANPAEARKSLETFLFYTNNQVNTKVVHLSGGEKVRLLLCLLTVSTPPILMLDEVSNNLDQKTLAYLCATLKEYKGSLVLVDHNPILLQELQSLRGMGIQNRTIVL